MSYPVDHQEVKEQCEALARLKAAFDDQGSAILAFVATVKRLEAQLAEAVRLLRDSECHYRHVWYEPHISEVADFLARHAQSEQQEAQGAQAGNERAAFERWAQDFGWAVTELGWSGGRYTDEDVQLQWSGWQARAALANQPAAGEPTKLVERGRAEFEAECRKQHRDVTRNDAPGFEWGYLNGLTHDRWCGFNMAVRCMGLDRAPPAAAHGGKPK